jgi:hypothetical protein
MRMSVLLLTGLIIPIAASLPSGAEPLSEPTDAAAPRAKSCGESFSRSPTEEFNKNCVALAGPLAAMRGEALVIRMDNGNRKIFDNKNGSGASEGGFGYGLADFYPSTHIFVVCDYGVDSGQIKAIYGKTGRELDFGSAFPQFSPDGNSVLAIEYSDDDETGPGFAILDVRGKQQVTVWTSSASKTPLPAKAKFVRWTDDKTIELASSDQTSVFLTEAADGNWNVGKKPN